MRVIVLLVLFELSAAAGAFAQADAALVARGQQVYAAQKCTICHAVAGKGNPKGPLDGVGSKLSADQTRMWIVNAPEMTAKTNASRKPAMKAYATLPKEDLEGLIAYMQSLKKK